MNTDNQTTYILPKNTLHNLSGNKPPEQLMPHTNDDIVSIEILTLDQYRYEQAFEQAILQSDLSTEDQEKMDDVIASLLPLFSDIPPHVKIYAGEIHVIVDCKKIDATIIAYVSDLLARIPSLVEGVYWEYLSSGDIK